MTCLALLLMLAGAGRAVASSPQGEARDISADFTAMDWAEMRIDSTLPRYSEVIPLESDFRQYDYQVTLEYPEYAPLTVAESQVAARYDSLVGERIAVSTFVGVQRKVGVLDVSFIPIIRQGGKYLRLVSARITITPTPKPAAAHRLQTAASQQARYAGHSVLSTGRWVKISVTEDGVYALTRARLKRMGFSDPAKVRLYGYGGHRQGELIQADTDYDDLQEIPLLKQDDNTWLFWANGLVYWSGNTRILNEYSTQACYFLTEGGDPATLETLPAADASASGTEVTSFTDHCLYERDEFAWFSGGRNLYDGTNYADGGKHAYRLYTTDSEGDERLTVAFTAGYKGTTLAQVNVNGQDVGTLSMTSISQYIYATGAERTFDVSGHSTGKLWSVNLASTAGHSAHLDYLALHYTRSIKVPEAQGYVAFSASGGQTSPCTFRIQCAPASTRLLRVDAPRSSAAMVGLDAVDGETATAVVDDPTARYVAVDITHSFPEPTCLGEVDNQDLHATDSLDMVIIIPASGKLQSEAQRLADAHAQYDGLRVGVFRADQIYNEYSSGTPDATAYRRFMKMLYDRAQSDKEAPRYLLLMGDCAWDNRMLSSAWKSYSPDDYLLCYESDDSFSDIKCYVMEDYFGLLDDGEGASPLREKSDLGIGRFPVTTQAEAKAMVDKCIAHMSQSNAGAWKNLVYVLGDDGDNNLHMSGADAVAEQVRAACPQAEVHKVYWDAYQRVSTIKSNTYPEVTSLLRKQMQDGALVMNYTGHGAAYTLSHEFVLQTEDFASARSQNLPLWVTAACDVMPFDGQSVNIGEQAVLNAQGGALAFYGTARTVFSAQNETMNKYFMKYLLARDSQGTPQRVGDAIRLAKTDIVANENDLSSYLENKIHYALLGDPALTVTLPANSVVVDSIAGVSLATGTEVRLRAGQRVRLTGHVQDMARQVMDDFQGVLTSRLFDSQVTVTCRNNADATSAFTYRDRTAVLCESRDSVRAGQFVLEFVVPVDISYSDASGRFVFYAIDDARQREADGYCERFTLGGLDDGLDADTIGPRIMAWLNSEDFQEGGVVNATPYFLAQIEDESGVNVSGTGVGHNLSLVIDGRADMTYDLNDCYVREFGDFTRGSVAFTIPTLEAGEHSLTFRAWDMLNNMGSTTLTFRVNPSLKPDMLSLTASQNPAVTSTNFLVSYNLPGAECQFTLDVYDFAGHRLWTTTQTGSSSTGLYSIPWDLVSGSGGRLGTGIYFYRCRVRSGESTYVSKTQKIVVINNK